MIEYIQGKIVDLTPLSVIIENNGIGYGFLISSETYHHLRGKENSELYAYLQITNQENMTLFGFSTKQERDFYKKLIQVSGIGPKLGIRALSQVNFRELNDWILNHDEKNISTISGIGKKTASKIIIEIKDKLVPLTGSEASMKHGHYQEALMALESLGFDQSKISAVLKDLQKASASLSLEEIIKKSLALLNKK